MTNCPARRYCVQFLPQMVTVDWRRVVYEKNLSASAGLHVCIIPDQAGSSEEVFPGYR